MIKIAALIVINNCILTVYYIHTDKMYRFSLVDSLGNIHSTKASFHTLSSAKFTAISITERLAVE